MHGENHEGPSEPDVICVAFHLLSQTRCIFRSRTMKAEKGAAMCLKAKAKKASRSEFCGGGTSILPVINTATGNRGADMGLESVFGGGHTHL